MKHLRLTLFLALALTALLTLSVSAANTPTAQLTVSQSDGQCTISVSADAPIGSIQFTLPASASGVTVTTPGYSSASGSDSNYAYVGFANQKFVAAGTDSGVVETEILSFPSENPLELQEIKDVEIGGLDGETVFETEVVVVGGTATIPVSVTCNLNGSNDTAAAVSVRVLQNGSEVTAGTASNGTVELEGLKDGAYQFEFSSPNRVTRTYNVSISGGAPTAPINVELNLRGDIDGDGYADIFDYLMILDHYLEAEELTGYAYDCGDVDGDGFVDIFDYLMILDHYLEAELLW